MKLRYYLRGLGIGILVTALIFVLSGNTGGRMSDEQVKTRAAKLGMVEKENAVLSDAAGDTEKGKVTIVRKEDIAEEEEKPEENAPVIAEVSAEPEAPAEAASGTDKNEESEPVENIEEASASEAEETSADEVQERAKEVAERGQEAAKGGEEAAKNAPGSTVTITVNSGDSSVAVAKKVEQAGLVESAMEFDKFLCQNGYDKRISVGSYEIPKTASEKEIADKITRS